MTYNEGWIEVVKGGADLPLDPERRDLPRFASLQARPGHGDYWVPTLQRWAQARGAPTRYIDNCWLGVAVSAAELAEFLHSLNQPGNTWIDPLIARIDPADSYLIWAEEY